MILAEQPVLDKGWIALTAHSNEGKELQDLQHTYFKTEIQPTFLEIANATFIFKCPLFVQLNLSKFYFKLINIPSEEIESYIPSLSDIGTGSNDDDMFMMNYLRQTTDSLVMNSKALPFDKCDPFIAQTLMPVSVYNKVVVHGTLLQWLKFLKQKNLPKPIESYRSQVQEALKAQWKNIDTLIKMV